MTPRTLAVAAILAMALPLSGQTYQRSTSYSTAQRALPSASALVSPTTPVEGQNMTITAKLNNPPLYSSATGSPPPPQYGISLRRANHSQVHRRDYSTSSSVTWQAPAAGSYYALVSIKVFKTDGTFDELTSTKSFTVASPKLTWTGAINASTLGSTPAAHLNGKSIKNIVNSVTSGRADGQKCNACHGLNMSKMYRPDTNQTITPSTTISRGDAYNNSYRWNMAGSSGVVERFCNGPGKPADLCAVFRKWAADGYQQ